jgi:hypothetical protein
MSILFLSFYFFTFLLTLEHALNTSIKKPVLGQRVAVDRSQIGLSQTVVAEPGGSFPPYISSGSRIESSVSRQPSQSEPSVVAGLMQHAPPPAATSSISGAGKVKTRA